MKCAYTQVLLLGSSSASRAFLLREAHIPFQVIKQSADETKCDWTQPLPQLVATIARYKMEHLSVPAGTHQGQLCYVLTADTLSQDQTGAVHGKPTDKQDAIAKIQLARLGTSTLATAFCLDKKEWKDDSWSLVQRVEQVVSAQYTFQLPDEWMDEYFKNSVGLKASNAIAIEGFGSQFVRSVDGSYTAIIGLPLFELRCALEKIGFIVPVAT